MTKKIAIIENENDVMRLKLNIISPDEEVIKGDRAINAEAQ
jgi:hypothetical protein